MNDFVEDCYAIISTSPKEGKARTLIVRRLKHTDDSLEEAVANIQDYLTNEPTDDRRKELAELVGQQGEWIRVNLVEKLGMTRQGLLTIPEVVDEDE